MPGLLDILTPSYAGTRMITLALADALATRRAFLAVDVTVALARAARVDGLVLPLEMTVVVDGTLLLRKYFDRVIPSFISFTPQGGGEHLVRLAEVDHNQWWGSLRVDIPGDPLTF